MITTRPFFGRLGSVLVAACCLTSLPAAATTDCQAQADKLRKAQADIVAQQAARDALLSDVEEAGETWQAAEQTRLFSEAHARDAIAAKSAYDGLKADLAALEDDLQSNAASVNAQIETFNANCATGR